MADFPLSVSPGVTVVFYPALRQAIYHTVLFYPAPPAVHVYQLYVYDLSCGDSFSDRSVASEYRGGNDGGGSPVSSLHLTAADDPPACSFVFFLSFPFLSLLSFLSCPSRARVCSCRSCRCRPASPASRSMEAQRAAAAGGRDVRTAGASQRAVRRCSVSCLSFVLSFPFFASLLPVLFPCSSLRQQQEGG